MTGAERMRRHKALRQGEVLGELKVIESIAADVLGLLEGEGRLAEFERRVAAGWVKDLQAQVVGVRELVAPELYAG